MCSCVKCFLITLIFAGFVVWRFTIQPLIADKNWINNDCLAKSRKKLRTINKTKTKGKNHTEAKSSQEYLWKKTTKETLWPAVQKRTCNEKPKRKSAAKSSKVQLTAKCPAPRRAKPYATSGSSSYQILATTWILLYNFRTGRRFAKPQIISSALKSGK